jgi:hypothetical protein
MNPYGDEDEDDGLENQQGGDQQSDYGQNDDGSSGEPDDGQQQQTAPVQQPLDTATIASIVASTMQNFQQQQPQQQRQMTPEEAAAHFQVWNPEEKYVNDLNKLVDPSIPLGERQQLLAELRDGLVNQSFRATELLLEQRLQQIDQRYAPVLALAQKQEAKALQKDFEGRYPQLKGQEELVNSITAGLSAQGYRPKSKDEAFESVAKLAEGILKKVNPEFKLTAAQSGGGRRTPAMAGTNMGGQTGGFQQQAGKGSSGKRGGIAPFFLNK